MNLLHDYEARRSPAHNRTILAFVTGLHVVLIGGALANNYLEVPPISEPALIIELQEAISPPPPPPPPAASDPVESVSVPDEIVATSPQETPDAPVLEPVAIVADIDLDRPPDVPAPVRSGSSGQTGGVIGGVVGGVGTGPAPTRSVPEGPVRDPDVHARGVFQPSPGYPRRARVARVEGIVILDAIIRTDGTVGDLKVIQGLGMKCTEAAIDAVRQWRYEPASVNGRLVEQILTVEVAFSLE